MSGWSDELPYGDDLSLVNETLEGLKGRLEVKCIPLKLKGLRVNVEEQRSDDY